MAELERVTKKMMVSARERIKSSGEES